MSITAFNPNGGNTNSMSHNIGMRDLSGGAGGGLYAGLNFNTASILPNIAFDSSGNHRHGLVSGATHLPTGGFNSLGAYDFDGVDDYIELNDAQTPVEFNPTAKEGVPKGLTWSPDRTMFFICGSGNREVHKWICSVPGDSNTAVFSQSSTVVNARETDVQGVRFSTDGTKMFILGNTGDDITYFTLAAWDLSTLAYVGEFSVAGQVTAPRAFQFKPDGTGFYVVGDAPNRFVYQYTLGTAWNMATASYASKSFDTLAQDSSPQGLDFKPDGTLMFVLGLGQDAIFVYSLSTAWDVSTASYTSISFYVGGQNTDPTDLSFTPDGAKVSIVGATPTSRMWTYTLPSTWSFSLFPNGLTLATWVSPDTAGEGLVGRIIDRSIGGIGECGYYYYITSANGARFKIGDRGGVGSDVTGAAASVPFGSYTNTVVTVNAAGLVTHYANGSVTGTPATTTRPGSITTINATRIGNRATGTDRTFDGKIDNVLIFNRVLSATEISTLYTSQTQARNFSGTPSLTTGMRNSIVSPPLNYVIFNITTNVRETWNGSAWV